MAISVTDDFKNAMKAPVKTLRARIVTDEETPQIFASSDNLVCFTYESVGYYFGAAITTVNITLIGTTYNLVGVGVDVSFDVMTASGDWETLDYGVFRVTEQTTNLEKGMTTIKALGLMGEAAQTTYVAGDIVFPCTVQGMVDQIAANFGVSVDTDITTLPNYDYTIGEDLYAKINNFTYRDILAEIAGATATMATLQRKDNTLKLVKPMMTPLESLTYDNLLSVKFMPRYGVINSVVLARTPQEDNIAVTDEASVIANGLTELKLANNEILDDDRQDLAQPILDAVDGFWFDPFEATTEGHGWHEVGDRVAVTDGVNTWEVIITSVKVEITGGIKETIKGIAPDPTQTDYARAGGITKTIYNTEIKVDKQNQQIESVVSKVEEIDGRTQEEFTQVIQNITNITNNIQTGGGANMIYNSVGYATDGQLVPTVWTVDSGTVTANTSPESLTYGAKSGNQINLATQSAISQTITATIGQTVSLSAIVKKSTFGTASIKIADTVGNEQIIELTDNTTYLWQTVSTVFTPNGADITITITNDNAVYLSITDLMLIYGDQPRLWEQASGEILNTNVLINKDGVIVKNNVYSGDYVQMTPLGLSGYSTADGPQRRVFSIDRDITYAQKILAEDQITMPPIKIVPLTDYARAGWAFVEGDN
jgi:hypothetical protein